MLSCCWHFDFLHLLTCVWELSINHLNACLRVYGIVTWLHSYAGHLGHFLWSNLVQVCS